MILTEPSFFVSHTVQCRAPTVQCPGWRLNPVHSTALVVSRMRTKTSRGHRWVLGGGPGGSRSRATGARHPAPAKTAERRSKREGRHNLSEFWPGMQANYRDITPTVRCHTNVRRCMVDRRTDAIGFDAPPTDRFRTTGALLPAQHSIADGLQTRIDADALFC